jgi:3-methyladenine DNA glycosylase AlkC
MEEATVPTADELLGQSTMNALVTQLADVAPGCCLAALTQAVSAMDGLGFRQRGTLLRDALLEDLPEEYPCFAAIIRAALANPGFTGWMTLPVGEAVAMRALAAGDSDAFNDGLALLAELTPRLSSEFAIRPLLAHDLDRALPVVTGWTAHPDEHVRRLASEGTRLYLPWAVRVSALLERPEATQPILDALYRDPSDYVRRSVANHLNDLSRLDPDLTMVTAGRWLGAPDANTARVVRHALRTLIKQGHPEALHLLGFPPASDLAVDGPHLPEPRVAIGAKLPFRFTIENRGDAQATLAIDYVIHYRKASGKLAPKVFKLTSAAIAPGESVSVQRAHSFKPVTTRVLYPGEHAIELQINGERFGRAEFRLIDPAAP